MSDLLDANLLIAVTVAEHERATRWVAEAGEFAICPVVEGALVRFLVRLGAGGDAARQVIHGIRQHPGCRFWEDSLSYADCDLTHVRGHRQVSDAYLASLAGSRGSRLATLDRALAGALPDSVVLVPDR